MAKRNEIVIPFTIILAAFYILFNIPSYTWYYAPFLFFLITYACRLIPATRPAQWATLLFAVCLTGASGKYLRHAALMEPNYTKLGDWLNQNTPRNIRIAAVEIGTLGWHCDRNIIDIVGLTTPRNAHFTAKHDFASWFAERPDLILVHPNNPFPWERVALSSPEYEFLPVHSDGVYILRKKPPSHE